jgi:hypothetical protein
MPTPPNLLITASYEVVGHRLEMEIQMIGLINPGIKEKKHYRIRVAASFLT